MYIQLLAVTKMKKKDVILVIDLLKESGVSFDKGLSENEIKEIRNIFNIEFPEDLKMFLKTRLPVSNGFVHWRFGISSERGKKEILQRLNRPFEGILSHIKSDDFWLEEWGKVTDTFENKKRI